MKGSGDEGMQGKWEAEGRECPDTHQADEQGKEHMERADVAWRKVRRSAVRIIKGVQ